MPRPAIIRFLSGAFAPPFNGLVVLVWVFFVWCFAIHPDTPILKGAFADSDDMIHLVRIMDWLQGQDWFDPVLHRLNPPEGTVSHFSRLAELPLAAIMWPLHQLGLSWQAAAYAAAAVWPLALLGFFLMALRWAAQGLMPRDWAGVSAFVALFAVPTLSQFSPGRVDHHGLVLLLIVLALGSVLRLMEGQDKTRLAIATAFLLASAQVVALESLLWVLMLAGWVGFWSVLKGRIMALPTMAFAASFYVFSALYLMLSVAPSQYFVMTPLAYSGLYVVLSAAVALSLAVGALAAYRCNASCRIVIGGSAALIIGVFFFRHFPALLIGPYGGMAPDLATVMMGNIGEALSAVRRAENYAQLVGLLLAPLFAFGVSLYFMLKADDEKLWRWVLLSLLLLGSLFLMTFYQVRFIRYAALFSVFPMSALLWKGWLFTNLRWQGHRLAFAKVGLILLVGPLLAVLIPANCDGQPLDRRDLLFPVQNTVETPCPPVAVWQMLALPDYYGDKPRLIMSTMNEGAGILFHTPHQALAAPYHTNVVGNMDSKRFFSTENSQDAEKIARARGVDLVLLCKPLPAIYRDNRAETMSLAELLVNRNIPDWLVPIDFPLFENALLFEVRPVSAKTLPP
ncbi:MAG TPA: hypothetical protein DCY07_02655 [Rhodospirillaceae bacterium]|nr:hypothetical protein [Rhodospirillaceae bacterium]